MPARLIAYPPEAAALVPRLVPGIALRIGRNEDCGLRLNHPSISRVHAELACSDGRWHLRDLGSKNGSHVDGVRVQDAWLDAHRWLRFGDVHAEFSVLGDEDARAVEAFERRAHSRATAHTARIDAAQGIDDLLQASLRAVVELAQCDRGFVLLGDGSGYSVRAHYALEPDALARPGFSGSIGAVERALAQRQPVVINDIAADTGLSGRASVIAGELRTLVCLPLLGPDAPTDEAALGAVYADRNSPGAAITTLDVELLQAFVERAALWLSAHAASAALALPPRALHWSDVLAAHAAPR